MRKAKSTADSLSGANPPDEKAALRAASSERLTEKKLSSILQVDKGKAKVNSVPTPLAQSVTLHPAPTEREYTYSDLVSKFHHISQYNEPVAMVFALLFQGGCRVSEVLSISARDIDALGNITIRSSKGGNTRVISAGLAAVYLLRFREWKVSPFEGISRHYVYKQFKKFGIGDYFGDNTKMSVTHAPRHMVALASKAAGRPDDLTKTQLGQKSVKSTEHYTTKKRGKKDSK